MEFLKFAENTESTYLLICTVDWCTFYHVAQIVKHLSATRETRVRSVSREYPLEKETAIRSSTLAWKIPWMEEPGRTTVQGVAKRRTRLSDFTCVLSALVAQGATVV